MKDCLFEDLFIMFEEWLERNIWILTKSSMTCVIPSADYLQTFSGITFNFCLLQFFEGQGLTEFYRLSIFTRCCKELSLKRSAYL